jgi:hypothetical protein
MYKQLAEETVGRFHEYTADAGRDDLRNVNPDQLLYDNREWVEQRIDAPSSPPPPARLACFLCFPLLA